METVGALAGGIAHDLNNCLAPVLMAAPIIRTALKNPSDLKLLDTVTTSALRGAEMVKQILNFSRGVAGAQRRVSLKALVTEMGQFAGKTFPRNIAIEIFIAEDLPEVTGNSTQLHQVLMNLCVNASDAMPTGGTLKVTARNAPKQFVQIRVEDSGAGIPPEVIERIFDPFFTTKEPGKGTGLGLSTVARIVKNHGGSVKVESEVGTGTVFEILLPAAKPD